MNHGWYTVVSSWCSTPPLGKRTGNWTRRVPRSTNFLSITNVFHARRGRGQKTRVALLGLIPFFAAWVLIPSYLYLNPIILNNHRVPFAFFVGLINAYSVGQIIVAHLTKAPFPFQNVLLLPITFGVADSLGPVFQSNFGFGWPSALGDDIYQVAFMFMCLGLAVGVYGSFVIDVIFAICDYLDIWCLTIKHPWTDPPAEETRSKKRA